MSRRPPPSWSHTQPVTRLRCLVVKVRDQFRVDVYLFTDDGNRYPMSDIVFLPHLILQPGYVGILTCQGADVCLTDVIGYRQDMADWLAAKAEEETL